MTTENLGGGEMIETVMGEATDIDLRGTAKGVEVETGIIEVGGIRKIGRGQGHAQGLGWLAGDIETTQGQKREEMTVTDHAKDAPHPHPKQTEAVHHTTASLGGHYHHRIRLTGAVRHIVRDPGGHHPPCLVGVGTYGALHPHMNREIGLAAPLVPPVTLHLAGIGSPVDAILRAQGAYGQTANKMGH